MATFRVLCLTGSTDSEFQTNLASHGAAHPFAPDEIIAKRRKVFQMLIRMARKALQMPNVLKRHFNNLSTNELETYGFNFP